MSASTPSAIVGQRLDRLAVRVRWKRWLGRLHRFAWILAAAFLICFAADWLVGMSVATLRTITASMGLAAGVWFVVDWALVWLVRVDYVGLAHLLEKRFPALAERLVTLVQLPPDEVSSDFAAILQSEVEQQLADVDPSEACPLVAERTMWLRTLAFFVAAFVGLGLTTPLQPFTQRFFTAWARPLTPFHVTLTPNADVALRGIPFSLHATIERLDDSAAIPTECELVGIDETGPAQTVPMKHIAAGKFLASLDTIRHTMAFRARVGAIESEPITVDVADPYVVTVLQGAGYVLRGESHRIEAIVRPRDQRAVLPKECTLIAEDESGRTTKLSMKPAGGRYTAVLKDLRQSLTGCVKAGEAQSEKFAVRVIDAPSFTTAPTLVIDPPVYAKTGPEIIPSDQLRDSGHPVVRFSRIRVAFQLDRHVEKAVVQIESRQTLNPRNTTARTLPVIWAKTQVGETAEFLAAVTEDCSASLQLDLGHGLSKTLPLGRWNVQDDQAPQFTQPLRFQDGSILSAAMEFRVSAKEALKLRTIVEDDAGLEAIFFEYRINDGPAEKIRWIEAKHQKKLAINHWLPLPMSLKETDRVQFRLHARDNRNLKRAEIRNADGIVLPSADLNPNVTTVPEPAAGASGWITLRIDPSAEDYLKLQAKAQSEDVFDTINKIKQKVQSELDQVQQLQGPIHRQAALTLAQLKQAEDLRALNHEISSDLLAAAKRFSANLDLAKLAEHLLDIAENELAKSGDALIRFSEKDRSLPEAEKELQVSQEQLLAARQKLDRLLALNKLITQDRLDQFQLDRLAKRQEELAQRLEKLMAEMAMNPSDAAKEIEAIRAEQAKLIDEAAKLQEQSGLAKESMQSLQQMRAEQLAKEAERLAAEQRGMRESPPDQLPAELKKRIADLARRQAEFAERVDAFAKKNDGPSTRPAAMAADSLKKPQLIEAIEHQREQEKQLQAWLDKLLPGVPAVALRDRILQLAKKQQAIHSDLARLAREIDQIEFSVFEAKYRDLLKRQQEMPPAIALLPIDSKNDILRPVQSRAQSAAQDAAAQLARENAAGAPAAFELMKKVQRELETLAGLLPATLPTDPSKIDDPKLRAKAQSVQAFAKEQQQLRDETQKLLGDAAKASAGNGKHPLGEKLDKLAGELKELAQNQNTPENKAMAQESADAIDAAKKNMDASQAMKAKGEAVEASKLDADAEKQLVFAVKQLAKVSQNQAKTDAKMAETSKTASALKEGVAQMRKAEDKLPTSPKDAQAAMNAAAQNLQQAAQAAAKQSASKFPQAARNPAGKLPAPGGRLPASAAKELPLGAMSGEAWGQLPGELKSRMLQDVRNRFGAEYAETIRQYFESLAETPPARSKD